ncbi:MAG: MFS transporter [Nostoc sp.]|uniref:MFS transporter n=1 Tax=Nostoc sp. TaxID=1180 RepID=UPI002FFC619B
MLKSLSINQTIKTLRPFLIIWFGQLVSLTGSNLTSFALDIWVYQKTGSVTQFALASLCVTLPFILISPIAGTFVDRWDKRWTMFFSDLGAGIVTLLIALLFYFDQLHIWYIYLGLVIMSICNVFQRLAATTATNLLVPNRHLGRALGIVKSGEYGCDIFTPLFSGILLLSVQLQGVLLIDCITYLFSLGTLLLVNFPNNQQSVIELDTLGLDKSTGDIDRLDLNQTEKPQSGSITKELVYGWRYISSRLDIKSLILYSLANNFIVAMVVILMMPHLLSFVSTGTAGTIMSIGSFGGFLGSIAIGIWGGPKRRIDGILGLGFFIGICIITAGLRPSITLTIVSIFSGFFCFAIVNALSHALLLTKISSNIQGRVFGLISTMSGASRPFAYFLAGPLVDMVFEPLLATNGFLANNVGMVIGVGRGRGIGLLFIVLGLLQVAISVTAYTYRPLRFIEKDLPNI